ncbi:hypothetical protein FN846DRAFT_896187, partial [Sphaerosporella brunnea]
MDVSRKRDNIYQSNAASGKRRKLNNGLSSGLDGGYWQRAPARRSTSARFSRSAKDSAPTAVPEEKQLAIRQKFDAPTAVPEEKQLAICQKFDIGLPVVFGQTSFPSPSRVCPYEVEEPESPPKYQAPTQRRLLRSAVDDPLKTQKNSYNWNFTPSWEVVRFGARILARTLTFPLAVARYLVDVAPETRRQARLIEAAHREQEQLLLEQWYTEHERNRRSSSERSLSPAALSLSSDNKTDDKLATMPATAGSSGSAAQAGLGGLASGLSSGSSGGISGGTRSSGSGGTTGGTRPSRSGSTNQNDPNAALLGQIQQLIESNMTALRLELSRESRQNDPEARDQALRAEKNNLQAKINAIEEERGLILSGQWNGPTTPLSPTSIYVAAAPGTMGASAAAGPAKPRFNPGDLPQIIFGEDLEEWISNMDHVVTSFGELMVCPHVLHRCFTNGDPMHDWNLTQPSAVHLFVTTGDGCWDRFKTLLRTRFKPDLGVMQYEADSYRRQPEESWAAFGIRKYRLLKRAYDGADEANIILKIKAVMETEVVRFCKEKTNIDAFIGELMDYDRTSPPAMRSPRRIFKPIGTPMEQQPKPIIRFPGPNPMISRSQWEKGKGVDRSGQDRGSQDRKATIQSWLNPDTGKMVRSYLNFQGKPVFIKRPCNLCEKAGSLNQMHFSFECPRSMPARPRTYALDGTEYFDELADGLHRTESGNLTSYDFHNDTGPHEVMYHQESGDEDRATLPHTESPRQTPEKFGPGSKKSRMKYDGRKKWEWQEEDLDNTPMAGSSCRNPTSGLARGCTRGSDPNSTILINADHMQTSERTGRKSPTDPSTYRAVAVDTLARPDDDFFHEPRSIPVREDSTGETQKMAPDETVGGEHTTPVAGSSWGNPPSGLAQGSPRGGSPISPFTSSPQTDQAQIRKLERPPQLVGDGKSYLRCTPLAAKLHLGSPLAAEKAALLDVCSNIGLIDRALFHSAYPEITVHPSSRLISGVGTAKTSGFAVIPVWMDCWDRVNNTRVTTEFDIEVHLVESFAPGLLLGLDAIRDYQMDLLTSSMSGHIEYAGLSFPLYSHAAPKFQKVRVFTSQKVTIAGRTTMPIRIKSAMQEGIDYVFDPYMLAAPSLPQTPQLPHAVIAQNTKFLMFSNHSEHPVHLDKNHAL